MENLAVNFCGKKFKNPVLAASGTFGFGREYAEFFDISKLGGICTKGLTREPRQGNDSPRICETAGGMLNSVGLQNCGAESFLKKELPFLKKYDTIIVANIAGNTEEDYRFMAKEISQGGVDFLEVNVSCPNVKCGGMAFGIIPENVRKITYEVKRHSKVPIIVKLSPNVANIADNARAAKDGGADAISLINTISGTAVDIKTRKPILANRIGGLSGKCVKPVALKMVNDCYKAVKIPIMGMGGIYSWQDAVEFMLCGASLVQVGTANLTNPLACVQIIDGLAQYACEQNLKSISDLVGGLI